MRSIFGEASYRIFSFLEGLLNFLLFVLLTRQGNERETGEKPRRVLLARLDLIGDFVLFTASLRHYRELYKNAELVLFVREGVFNLAEHCPYVDKVWCLHNKKFRLSLFERLRWLRKVRSYNFDIAINAVYSTSWRHLDCIVGWTRAPRRIAHQCLDATHSRLRPGPYFTELVPADNRWKFTIDRDFDLLKYLGHAEPLVRETRVILTDKDRVDIKALVPVKPYAVLCPSARYAIRQWAPENFVRAIIQIQEKHPLEWVVCGSNSERTLCERIVQQLRQNSIVAINVGGRTTLRQLGALLEHAEMFLGNESGPAHLAVAVGTPTACVVGGGLPNVCYPYPGNSLTVAVRNELPCYYCFWKCVLEEPECITKIPVTKAVEAVIELLSAKGREPDRPPNGNTYSNVPLSR